MTEQEQEQQIECPYYEKCDRTWDQSPIYQRGSQFYKMLCGSKECFNCAELQRKKRAKEKDNYLEKRT